MHRGLNVADNVAMEVLKIIKRNPRISPALIHNKMKKGVAFSIVEFALRTLRETEEVETLARGLYVLTDKGVKTLKTEEESK